MLYGRPDMVPLPNPVAEVCAVAKRDLAMGEIFDAIGETCYRSFILTTADAREKSAVPVGLLEGGKVLIYTHGGAYTLYTARSTLNMPP